MQMFTVIGFWPDNGQRFCASVKANSADHAESCCIMEHPGLAVCGVVEGTHRCLESAHFVDYGHEDAPR